MAKFYLDRDAEPTLLTRDVSRLFLGRNVTCAQCHDHPSVDEYKQEQFYGVMAFLNRTTLSDPRANTAVLTEKPEGEVSFQNVFDKAKTIRSTRPRLPGREVIDEPKKDGDAKGKPAFSRRAKLAEELVAAPAFRRTAANRFWAMLTGRGLVHPLDLDHADNPPSHPELLDLLAAEFTAHKCDVRGLLREIALSQTYQRSSERPVGKELAEDRFAAALLKPLSPEQFARAAMQATGFTDAERQALGKNLTEAALHAKLAASVTAFVQTFGSRPGEPEGATFQATLDQALFLGNGAAVRAWLPARSGNLADRLVKTKTTAELAEELYLSVLTRRPSDEEAKEVADFLAASPDRPAAVGELIWALVASTEFRFNH
jgi:hypothetical protein